MFGLLVIVAGIALGDSLNPSTLAPAAFLATGRRARRALASFILGLFCVSFVPGLVVALGPGQLLVARAHHPRPAVVHLVELGGGALALVAALAVWLARERVASAFNRTEAGNRSAFALGAGIMAAELPTAFPYFAALAAIVASGRALPARVALVALYNVLFVAPLLTMLGAIVLGGPRADALLERANAWLRRHVATVTCGLLGVVGTALVAVGSAGLAAG